MSIEIANKVYTVAYIALVVGAVLTAVSTMSLFWASAIRDKYADQQIESAKENAALAGERAGKAQEAAADATERSNVLALAAEQARAEQERLKIDLTREQIDRLKFQGEFSWRIITADVGTKMVEILAPSPSIVTIGFVSGDPEATFLAIQFAKVFSDAGWQVRTSANTYAGTVFFGLIISDTSPAKNPIQSVLNTTGMLFVTSKPPAPTMSFGDVGAADLIIGSKPIPTISGLPHPCTFPASGKWYGQAG